MFLLLYSITWPYFIHCMVAFTLWDIGQYKDCNCFLTSFCIKAFESILNFLNKLLFSKWTKRQDKNSNIFRTKRVFKMKQKAFFIIFTELSLKQIKQFVFEGESWTLIIPYYFKLLTTSFRYLIGWCYREVHNNSYFPSALECQINFPSGCKFGNFFLTPQCVVGLPFYLSFKIFFYPPVPKLMISVHSNINRF